MLRRAHSPFALLVLGAALDAQQPEARALPSAPDTATLPPIAVTATRTSIDTLRLPLAVSVVPAAALRATRGVGLDDALRLVPGVLAQSRSGGTDVRIVIRGFGARGAGDRSNAGTSRGVRILLDGIPETEPDGRTSLDQIDLDAAERVDVVRSSAGALWGNAAGGVVAISSMPASGAPRLSLRALGGSFGLARTSLRVSATPGAGAAWGTLTHTTWRGWRAQSAARRTLVNAGAAGAIGERTRLTVLAAASDNLFRIPGPLTREELERDPTLANAAYAARDERRHNRIARLGASLRHEPGPHAVVEAMLFLAPKYLQRSERGTYRDFTRYHLGGSALARRTWPLDNATTLAIALGADEAHQDGAALFYTLTPEGQRGTTLRENQREGANNAGIFAVAELRAARLTLDLGLRWDDIRYDVRNFAAGRPSGRKSFRRLTPKVGAAWSPAPGHALYASVGGGIEAPAGNETDPAGTFGADTIHAINPLLDAIRSTTYEAGFRSVRRGAARAAFAYDVAAYLTEVRNEIVPYQGGRFHFTAARARRSGLELGLDAAAERGPFARAAIALSRNHYAAYVVDSVHYGAPGARADYSGNAVVGVPPVIGSAELGWRVRVLGGARVKGVVEGLARYWADDANRIRVPGHAIVHAVVDVEGAPLGGWSVGGFAGVYNLADRRYVGSAFLNPERRGGEPVAFEPGSPRSLAVLLSVRRSR